MHALPAAKEFFFFTFSIIETAYYIIVIIIYAEMKTFVSFYDKSSRNVPRTTGTNVLYTYTRTHIPCCRHGHSRSDTIYGCYSLGRVI